MSGIPTIADDLVFPGDGPNVKAYGLTKREHFAVQSLQGLAAYYGSVLTPSNLAEFAVQMADALIKRLNE